MGYQMIGGQMVLVPDNVTPEEIKQVNDDIEAGRVPAPTQNLSDEDITRIMTVPGGGKTVPVQAKPVTPAPMPVSEIYRQEQKQAIEQKRQEDLRRISEVPTTSGKATSTIPFDRKYYDAIDFGDNAGRTIWRALTPWSEERGEIVKTYIEAIPEMYTGKYDTQERLKDRYEAEQANQLWTRILLGGDTVKYDKKNNLYISIIAGEAPLVTTASKAANIPVNIAKIKNIATQYKLNPSWYAGIQNRMGGVLSIPKQVLSQGGKIKGAAIGEIRGLGQIRGISGQIRGTGKIVGLEKEVIDNLPDTVKVVLIPQLYINPNKLTKETVKIIDKLPPEKAIQQLKDTELLKTITISEPETIIRIMPGLDPEIQKEVITNISEAIEYATQQQEISKAQHKRITDLINKIRERNKELIEATEETSTQTATKEKEKTQTQTVTETKTEVKTEVETPTKTKEKTTDKPPDERLKGGGGGDSGGNQKRRIYTSSEAQKQARKVVKESDGAIAWRMGKLGGKDRWDTVVNPYTSNEQYLMILGRKPEGATILQRGKGSAYGTTQVVRGTAPKRDVKVDSGIVDVTISPTGKKSVRMKVTPDPQQETTGDITIGKGRISEISPRISRRSGRISPKMPKLK